MGRIKRDSGLLNPNTTYLYTLSRTLYSVQYYALYGNSVFTFVHLIVYQYKLVEQTWCTKNICKKKFVFIFHFWKITTHLLSVVLISFIVFNFSRNYKTFKQLRRMQKRLLSKYIRYPIPRSDRIQVWELRIGAISGWGHSASLTVLPQYNYIWNWTSRRNAQSHIPDLYLIWPSSYVFIKQLVSTYPFWVSTLVFLTSFW